MSEEKTRNSRKAVKPTLFQRFVFVVTRSFLKLKMKKKYGFTVKPVKVDEPFILLSNHTTDNDIIFAILGVKNQMFFVCSEHLVRRSAFIRWGIKVMNGITMFKGSVALGPTREMLQRIKEGNNICLFPEGHHTIDGRTTDFDIGVAKMVKHAKCALVTYRIKGGYFVQPRWSPLWRKGPMSAEVVHVYSSDEVKNMPVDELFAHIKADLHEDAYLTQNQLSAPYSCEQPALGLENAFFICPKCGAIESFTSSGNSFECSKCGLQGSIDELGILNVDGFDFKTVADWTDWQCEEFKKLCKLGELKFRNEGAILYELNDNHELITVAEGTLEGDLDGISVGDFRIAFSEMNAIDFIKQENTILFSRGTHNYYLDGEYLGGYKYGLLYEYKKSEAI